MNFKTSISDQGDFDMRNTFMAGERTPKRN